MADWVSVEDKLPALQTMVLCYMPLSYNGSSGMHWGWLSERLDHRGLVTGARVWKEHSPHSYAHDMEDERYTGTAGSKVTHWARRPTPPAPTTDDTEAP